MLKKIFLTALLGGISGVALASGNGEGGSLLSFDMLFKTINFLLLLYLLNRFARKPIAKMLSSSAENTKKATEDAKAELEEAKQMLGDYQSKLANLEKELEERKSKALEIIEAEKQQLMSDAEEQVKKLENQSQARIEQDIIKAKADIREFLVNESVKLAEETISKEINDKAQKALLTNYAKFLKETA
ncbi:ATP synthase F0 subunit B [bacterium]|nr:ATP synthase F0 subunit B [bacterium]